MKTKCRNQDHTGEPHSLDQSCLVDGVKTKPQTHTQGPWEVGGIGPDKYLVVKRNPVNLLVTAAIAEAAKEEDARLIAAAPDLLAFIESKRHIFQGKPATGQDFADFLAIITRAEGRE